MCQDRSARGNDFLGWLLCCVRRPGWPVVDEGRLVGMLSIRDISRLQLKGE